MTTFARGQAREDERPGLLYRLTHPRRAAETVRSDIAANVAALTDAKATLLSGKTVRFRWAQMTLWGIVAGLIGAQFIFGLYDGLMEIHWYITIPGIWHQNLFDNKTAWDSDCFGLVHSGNWDLYRHIAFRGIPGTALATMAVKTLLAPQKTWKRKPAGRIRIITGPVVVVLITYAFGVAGVWLGFFGLPDLWAHITNSLGYPGYVVPGTKWLGYLSATQWVIGFVIAQVLHRYWMPIGATLQGGILDRSVDRWQNKITDAGMSLGDAIRYSNAGLNILPRWLTRWPAAPPVLRERFALMWRNNTSLNARSGHARLIAMVTFVAALITIIGFIGHYVAGHGIAVPYLFPAG